jgi:hypothetical protein
VSHASGAGAPPLTAWEATVPEPQRTRPRDR